MTVSEVFINRIETECALGLSKIDAAEKRGYLSAEDLKFLADIEYSKIPIAVKAYELAARYKGKQPRNRDHMCPDVRARKGLHVSNSGQRPALYLYGAIGMSYGGVSAIEFQSQLAQFRPDEPIDLHIHSPGGSFTDGVAIHSLIRNRPGDTYAYIDGNAASAASLLILPCTTITMAPASQQMIHFAAVEPQGSWTEEDLATALKVIRDTNAKLLQLYLARWKGTQSELRDALAAESYYTAAEAVEHGLADFISDSVKVAAYEVVTGTCKTPGFSIAANEGPHKQFNMRRASLRLWQLELSEMRREIA